VWILFLCGGILHIQVELSACSLSATVATVSSTISTICPAVQTVIKLASFEFLDFSEQYDSLASDGAAIIFRRVNTFLPLQVTCGRHFFTGVLLSGQHNIIIFGTMLEVSNFWS